MEQTGSVFTTLTVTSCARVNHFTSVEILLYYLGRTGHGGSDGLHAYVPSLDYAVTDLVYRLFLSFQDYDTSITYIVASIITSLENHISAELVS